MIELTTQQSHEIKNAGWAPEFKDPDTGEVFVLLSKEMYEALVGCPREGR